MSDPSNLFGGVLVYWCFVVLGASSLLPWNLFITAHSYFSHKLRNTSDVFASNETSEHYRTYLQRTFEVWLTVSASITMLLGTLVNVLLTARISNQTRLIAGHILCLLGLIPTIILTLIDTDSMQLLFFIIQLLLCNLSVFGCNGLICSCTTGLAAKFPSHIMQAMMFGQSAIAVVVSSIAIGSQAATPAPKWNGLLYFLLAFSFSLFSLICYFVLRKSEYAKWYLNDANHQDDHNPLITNDDPTINNTEPQLSKSICTRTVTRKVLYESLVVFMVYTVTLSAFPALASLVITRTNNPVWKDYFTPVACFLLFNVGDSFGRLSPRYVQWPKPKSKLLLLLALARVSLVPLILFCNGQPRHLTEPLLTHDSMFVMNILILSITNGYFVTLTMTYGTKRVDVHEREMAGGILILFSVVGVCFGCIVGTGVVHLL